MRRREGNAQVIAIASGKGGTGKTNVAANLAICLMASRKDVLLIDADLGLANLDVVMNVKVRHTLAQVIDGKKNIDEIIQRGPAGLKMICGASGLARIADLTDFERQRIVQQFSELENKADIIIIDTGAGISQNVLGFCESAQRTVVVVTPEPTSITDAYALIKRLSQEHSGTKISLLVNMAESRADAKKVYQRLAGVAGRFLSTTVYDAGYILRDEHVRQAVSQRQPVTLAYPRCQASYCFMALAGKLSRPTAVAADDEGFFKKVVNWFF